MSQDLQLPEREALRQRTKWLIACRLVTAAVLVVGTLLFRPGGEGRLFGPSFWVVFGLTIGHLGVAAIFAFLHRIIHLVHLGVFAFSQIVWDLLFTTGLVYITGGIESEFKFMYWLTIVNAAILLFRKGAFTSAGLSSVLYGTLVDLEYFSAIPVTFVGVGGPEAWIERKVIASIVLNTIVFFAIAYVSSYVSHRLRQAESKLVEKSMEFEDLEALMGRIVDSLTSGLVTLDPAGRISFWSRAAELITQRSADHVRGKEISDIFPDLKSHFELSSDTASDSTRPWRSEMRFRRPDGTEKILGFSTSPLRADEGVRRGTLILFQDVTNQRHMEDRIKRADRLAAVGELAARIAHEIRNPLTSVSGAVEVLRNNLRLTPDERRLMGIAVRETDRLNSLLTDFLLFARPSAPRVEEVPIHRLLQETADLFSKSQGDGRIRFALDLDPTMSVQGDPKQLSQMVWNLMKNASEAMTLGGQLTLTLRRGNEAETVMIEVRDEGGGIAPELLDQIFHPFFTTKTKGTGLGLAIVRRIAQEHGGEIDVDSKVGEGTVFRVTLPALAAPKLAAGGA
ncbi:MAG TPA: ATP-binding protein [Bdellovibrionota bacterium]|nr:ATP-binding protein [Bdellovibrionota bacterium]